MKRQRINKKTDGYMTLLIGFFLIFTLTFNYLELGKSLENYIMLTILMITAVISYYLNTTTALIISLIIDFIYMTIKLYLSITSGLIIDGEVGFWIIFIPICNIVVSLTSEVIQSLQKKVNVLVEEKEKLSMIDEDTGLRNLAAYINEMPIYLNIFRRYKLPITLVLVRIKHGDKLKKIVGENYYNEVLVTCFEELSESLRYEDRKYIVDKDTFAYIIISDKNGSDIVKNRLKEAISKLSIGSEKYFKDLDIQVQIGTKTATDETKDSMHLLTLTEKELEYDV